MENALGPVVLGIVIAALGIGNMRGNIASIHWYHRRRVSEADRLPFGRMVGLGTLIIGVGMLLFGGLTYLAGALDAEICIALGTAVLIAALVAGLGLSFRAMIKYNKGIF